MILFISASVIARLAPAGGKNDFTEIRVCRCLHNENFCLWIKMHQIHWIRFIFHAIQTREATKFPVKNESDAAKAHMNAA